MMSVHRSACLLAAVMVGSPASAQTWTHEYAAGAAPEQSQPRFHVEVGDGGGEVRVQDGKLVIRAPVARGGAFVAIGTTSERDKVSAHRWGMTSAWDGSRPTTVEVRMRVVELLDGCALAAMLQVSNQWLTWGLYFGRDGLYRDGSLVHPLDTSRFHDYRITMRGGEANAFVDGERLPQSCLNMAAHSRNALMVGDFSSAAAGVTEWHAIRWTNAEATPFEAPEKVSSLELDPRFELSDLRVQYPCVTGGASAVLGDGRILLLYSGPVNPHGQPPGTLRIYGRISADGGCTWGEERELVHHPECQTCGPSLLRARDGTLRMVYMGFHASVWEDGNPVFPDCRSDLWSCVSHDDGETWEGHQCIWKGYTGATNGLIETSSGALVVPFSYNVVDPGRLVSACVVSRDEGKTWTLGECIDMGGAGDHAGAIEPTVVELRDGRILMLIRTQKGCFHQAFSEDQGLTWTAPEPTALRSPNAPCHVARLASGRLAVAWNNTMDPADTAATTGSREAISIALSDDDGATWTEPIEYGKADQLSYPFILEVAPGRLLIACNHVQHGWQRVAPVVVLADEETIAGPVVS